MLNSAKKIEVTKKINICRDPKDDIFLSLAFQENAHYIVTGDKDLLEINKELLLKLGLKKLKIIRISEI
jgi:predicted nucleic acid-binding protein